MRSSMCFLRLSQEPCTHTFSHGVLEKYAETEDMGIQGPTLVKLM